MASFHPIETHNTPPKGWAGVRTRDAAAIGAIVAGLVGLAIAGVEAREVPIVAALVGGVVAGLGAVLARRHA